MPMPIPLSQPVPTPLSTAHPYHLRQREDWAIWQERQRHDEALYRLGEYSLFFLMWALLDFQAGLVTRCARCYGTAGSVSNREAQVYQQPSLNRCPDCFGTTFEGGFRAKIIRPAIWSDADESEGLDRKGVVHPGTADVETTWDFRMRQGDYIVRADGSRWRLPTSPKRVTLHTGYEHPAQKDNAITYTQIQARLEEVGTVAYDLAPVDKEVVTAILSQPSLYPRDFSTYEQINSLLIPADGIID